MSASSRSSEAIVEVALVVPLIGGRLLVAPRAEGRHLAGFWEFPGGKIADGEQPADAARRELAEETGLVARELEPLVVVTHEYPERSVRLHAYLARTAEGEAREPWCWKTPEEVRGLAMPAANGRILSALRWRSP